MARTLIHKETWFEELARTDVPYIFHRYGVQACYSIVSGCCSLKLDNAIDYIVCVCACAAVLQLSLSFLRK